MPFLRFRAGLEVSRRGLAIICAAGAVSAWAGISSAAVSLPTTGGSGTPSGDSAGFLGIPAADLTFENQQNSPVGTFTVNSGGLVFDLEFYIQTTIYKDTSVNPAGTMDFIYQLHNISDDNADTIIGDSINRLTLQSFAGYGVTADYQFGSGSSAVGGDGGLDAPPLEIDRSTSPGAVVGFDFSGPGQQTTLLPGSYSDNLYVITNSTSYTTGTASVIGGLGQSTPTQVPFGAALSVPEPASLGMLAIMGSSLLGRRRRRNR
jgi:hypothetical protein